MSVLFTEARIFRFQRVTSIDNWICQGPFRVFPLSEYRRHYHGDDIRLLGFISCSFLVIVPTSSSKSTNSKINRRTSTLRHSQTIMSLHQAASRCWEDEVGTTTVLSSQDFSIPAHDFLDHVLQVAIEASRNAGDIIVGNAGGAQVTEWKANSAMREGCWMCAVCGSR
jgi:hypothetical protein